MIFVLRFTETFGLVLSHLEIDQPVVVCIGTEVRHFADVAVKRAGLRQRVETDAALEGFAAGQMDGGFKSWGWRKGAGFMIRSFPQTA